ncbi:MAG: hypothetical protein ABIF09_02615 [Gemmatimonadota bacterium]
MTAAIAIAVFVLFFALFALLGPAERSRGCGGRGAGEERCGSCPLDADKQGDRAACPGAKGLKDHPRKGAI